MHKQIDVQRHMHTHTHTHTQTYTTIIGPQLPLIYPQDATEVLGKLQVMHGSVDGNLSTAVGRREE